jgi:hypothetical protein
LEAVSKDAANKIDNAIIAAAADPSTQYDISQQLIQTGKDRTYGQITFLALPVPETNDMITYSRSLGLSEKSIIIEIGLYRLGFLGGSGSDPLIMMQLEAYANVVRTADGGLVRSQKISYTSVPRRASAWIAEDAALLKQEMASAYRMVAEDLVDTLFFVSDYGSRKALSGATGSEYCIMKNYTPLTTGSLRPSLQWQPFMRALQESERGEDISSRIGNVTYDLLIWREGGVPSENRIYERRGITSAETMIKVREIFSGITPPDQSIPETYVKEVDVEVVTHTVEVDLEPAAEYYWSVRARYTLDGQTNITRWSRFRRTDSFSKSVECFCATNDLGYYYRFSTPGVDGPTGKEVTYDVSPEH